MARKNNNEKKHVNNQKSISLHTGTDFYGRDQSDAVIYHSASDSDRFGMK